MTPEEVEARFQRIELILAQTAEYSRITAAEFAEQFRRLAIENAERDRRLAIENTERDRFFTEQLAERDRQNAERDRRLAAENAERDRREEERDRREENREERVELMMIGINALVESSIEYKRWKVETDQRFDILLQEVRATNQRVAVLENQQ
jgi:hypothetical protein